jgi:uncharacterized membrane protein
MLFAPMALLLAFAPSALARTYSGEGLYGATNDKEITEWMFAVMIFFVLVIVVFSLLQAFLEHRKHAREDAAKARKSAVEWKGGW